MGINLSILRNFIGGNVLLSQGGLFIKNLNKSLGKWTSLIINGVQFIFILIGLFYVVNQMGKRPLFLISVAVLSISCLALTVAMIYQDILGSMLVMCFYMAIYGSMFISPIWAYPYVVVPTAETLGVNMAQWLSLSVSLLVPPIVSGIMPDNNPYPVFFFFAAYGFVSFIHIYSTLKESDGKSYDEIIQSYT